MYFTVSEISLSLYHHHQLYVPLNHGQYCYHMMRMVVAIPEASLNIGGLLCEVVTRGETSEMFRTDKVWKCLYQ